MSDLTSEDRIAELELDNYALQDQLNDALGSMRRYDYGVDDPEDDKNYHCFEADSDIYIGPVWLDKSMTGRIRIQGIGDMTGDYWTKDHYLVGPLVQPDPRDYPRQAPQ